MSQIRSIVESFDNTAETGRIQRELVENLAKLAESKAAFFELQISTNLRTAGSPDNQTVPVEAVISSMTQTHAFTSDSAGHIADTVTKALKGFCTGSKDEIINGVGSLITEALTVFLGSGSAETDTLKQYYIMTEGLSIVRVDLMAWYLSVEATGIKEKIQKASAFSATKSAVDITKIKFNTFLNIYQRQLNSMNLNESQIGEALDEAKKIYQKFQTMNLMASGEPSSFLRIAKLPGA